MVDRAPNEKVGGLSGVVQALNDLSRLAGQIASNIAASLVNLSTNNTFSGLNTFTKPPQFEAGAGSGLILPRGRLDFQFNASGVGNGADLTDDTLFSFSLPAKSFDIAKRGLLLTAFGSFANNTNNKTVKLFFGSSIVFSTGVVTTQNLGWWMQLLVFKTAAGAQLGSGIGFTGGTQVSVPLALIGTETDTGAITLKATGASPTAGAANDVRCYGMLTDFND